MLRKLCDLLVSKSIHERFSGFLKHLNDFVLNKFNSIKNPSISSLKQCNILESESSFT